VKPTYGAVSRYGLMAMASSFDQIGPIAKNVTDAELIFEAIRGHDPLDSTSIEADAYQSKPTKSTYRVGVPRKFVNIDGLDKDVRELFEQMLKKIESAGHEVVDVDLPYLAHALPAYYILVPAEVSANLARYDGIRYGLSKDSENLLDVYKETRKEGFGPEVRRRILLGTYVLSAGYYDAYYYKANTLREIIRNDFLRVYKDVDVIIMPTATTPAYKIGEKTDDPLAMYLGDIFTVSANVAGVPAISLPMGNVEREGTQLPVGIQLLAEHKQEPMLFDVARIVEGLGKS
jgi:aspartyl-tRNA(Asn)/glutamyl-tRNA(Gln) amidotransferase subunit A